MPAYYNEQTRTWYCKFYYTDWTGTKKQKKKSGFARQKDAKEWERDFLQTQQRDVNMPFKSFVKVYFEDMSHRLRKTTLENKRYIMEHKILPYFSEKLLSEITPADIRKWQNTLISYRDDNGKPYSQTYLKTTNNQLSALFNYAVRYYGLKENPCHRSGSMGKKCADEMKFWTTEELKLFLEKVSDKPMSRAGFLTLYFTGLRIGELLALELADIDFENCKITVSKSYQRLKQEDIITPPKTPKSNRVVSIPEFLRDELKAYTGKLYALHKHDRIFPATKRYFDHELRRGTNDGTVKRIRIHDLRHSHASHLIELGFTPLAIADRLGHEKVETTLNTYSHLFPKTRDIIAEKLQKSFSDIY